MASSQEPGDVGDARLYLASPLARYVSSAGILMHGGGENPPAWARRVHRSNFAGFTSDYVQRVDSSGEFKCRMRHQGVVVAVNSIGLNDREVDEAAPHYRVLVLSDSLTLAAGVEQAHLYHSLVEAQFARDLGTPKFVEFYNAGRSGRTLARELRDLEQALSRWPLDAVLVGVSPSDLCEGVQESDSCGPGHDELLLGRDDRRLYDRSVRGRNWLTRLVGDLEGVTGLWTVNQLSDLLRRSVRWRNESEESRRRMLELEQNAVAAFQLCARRPTAPDSISLGSSRGTRLIDTARSSTRCSSPSASRCSR